MILHSIKPLIVSTKDNIFLNPYLEEYLKNHTTTLIPQDSCLMWVQFCFNCRALCLKRKRCNIIIQKRTYLMNTILLRENMACCSSLLGHFWHFGKTKYFRDVDRVMKILKVVQKVINPRLKPFNLPIHFQLFRMW